MFGLTSLVAAGCHRGPDLVPVNGQVTLDGQPVEGAAVMLHPENGGRPATGKSDAAGQFALTTLSEGDGALPGKHKVTVALTKMLREIKEGDPWDESAVEYVVPARYGSPQTSGLSAEVVDGMPPLELKLTR